MEFKDIIKNKRKELGLTQGELAKMLHVSKGAVAMWETGQRIPQRKKMYEISEKFGIDMSVLYGSYKVKYSTRQTIDNNFLDQETIKLIIETLGSEHEGSVDTSKLIEFYLKYARASKQTKKTIDFMLDNNYDEEIG